MNTAITKELFGDNLNKSFTLSEVLSGLDKLNFLNHGEMAEVAISRKSGVKQCDKMTENIDLENGVQIKHAKTHLRSKGQWIATISRNTTAPMFVVIYETNTKKEYFLNIPYQAHRHLSGNTISISFGRDGLNSTSQWWKYEVESFEKLCEMARNA